MVVPTAVIAEIGHVLMQLIRLSLLPAKEEHCLVQELVLTTAATVKETMENNLWRQQDVVVMTLLQVLCDVVRELRYSRKESLKVNMTMITALRESVKEMNTRQWTQGVKEKCCVLMVVRHVWRFDAKNCLSRIAAAQASDWGYQKMVSILADCSSEDNMLMV